MTPCYRENGTYGLDPGAETNDEGPGRVRDVRSEQLEPRMAPTVDLTVGAPVNATKFRLNQRETSVAVDPRSPDRDAFMVAVHEN